MLKINFRYRILLVLLGCIGALIVFLITGHYGAGISPDSAYYVAVARNISSNYSFIGYDGNYLVLQPPFYPIVLSIIKIICNIDPQISAGYLNSVLFGVIIYFSGLFLFKILNSIVLSVLGTISILISYVIIEASLLLLTESLFILIVVLFLYTLEIYQSKPGTPVLIILSVLASLAFLTRYIGGVLIFTGVISIFIWQEISFQKKFKHIIIFMLISALPIFIWIIRNYSLSGTLFGDRGKSSFSFLENLDFYITTVIPWYLPKYSPKFFPVIIFAALIIWYLSELNFPTIFNLEKFKIIGPAIFFIFLYSTLMIVLSTVKAFDQISDRLLSPIYVPIIFCLFYLIDKILNRLKSYYPHNIVPSFLFALSIILMMRYPAKTTINIIKDYYKQSGYEYSSKLWRDNETIKFLEKQKDLLGEYKFYSNAPEAVYILTQIITHWSPGKTMYNSPILLDVNSRFRKVWRKGDKICLVWFTNINRNCLVNLEELQKETEMSELAHFDDGHIYTFIKR